MAQLGFLKLPSNFFIFLAFCLLFCPGANSLALPQASLSVLPIPTASISPDVPFSKQEFPQESSAEFMHISTEITSLHLSAPSTTPAYVAPVGFISSYLIFAPLAPQITLTQPIPISSSSTPVFDDRILPSPSSMGYTSIPQWEGRPSPTITGVTIIPTPIPQSLISTFYGDLGWAKTKGYVIPVDPNGHSGWHKALATDRVKSGVYMKPNQIPASVPVPDFPNRLQAHVANRTLPQRTVFPTPGFNETYNDDLKIAAVQAFAQLGVMFLAVLIIIAGVLAFVCCSSILRWPVKAVHGIKFRGTDRLRNMLLATKMRAGREDNGVTREIARALDGSIGDPGAARRYMGEITESVTVDSIVPMEVGSSENQEIKRALDDSTGDPGAAGIYIVDTTELETTNSIGSVGEGSLASRSAGSYSDRSTMSYSASTGSEGTRDENTPPTVATVSTGSQSKAEGSRLRVIGRSC